MRTENSKVRSLPPRMIVRSSSDRLRLEVEAVPVDHPVLAALRHDLVRIDLEQPQEVVQLDREQAARPEHLVGLRAPAGSRRR